MKLTGKQTVFLREGNTGLENLLRITVETDRSCEGVLYINEEAVYSGTVADGQVIEVWVQEPCAEAETLIQFEAEGEMVSERLMLKPPRHLEFHMVHMSHHDPGYTDLMSHVFRRHYEWIDSILDEMDRREDYPDETRLRISIEQFWSLDYYLNHAPADRVAKVIERVKKGDIEITALYGNLITEQLGHEESYRALYEAERFAKECGVRVKSACHMDIPGISWGMCRTLCDAGIEFLAADFPRYYDWGFENLVSFWDTEKIYGHKGPGAFYWKAPDGKQLLLWNSHDIIGFGWDEEWIESIAEDLDGYNYPFDTFRASVRAAPFDNSSYIPDFADGARQWNERYAYPKVIISTNERFQEELIQEVQRKNIQIPVAEGDLPGQDYPVAAMSMQQVTSAARKVQHKLAAAEKLITLAGDDIRDQSDLLKETWRDLLLADDHAYGYQFSAGSAMRASYWEKGVYAMRAEATVEDLFDNALSSFADRVGAKNDNLRMIVFNAAGIKVSQGVSAPMREMDNCGTILFPGNDDPERLKGYILNRRRRVNPDEALWRDGKFKLVDMETGKEVPYYIDTLSWDDPEYYAADRCGLAAGGVRYGIFEHPGGMERLLRFVAEDVPAFGYKCYEFVPAEESHAVALPAKANGICNGIYKVSVDEGGITSIVDMRSHEEILDTACPHRLGDVLVRNKRNKEAEAMQADEVVCRENGLYSEVTVKAHIDGAHELCVKVSMWRNIDKIEVSLHMLRSAKPLQTMLMAFPFKGEGFAYQGLLCELEPGKNLLPGAQSDFLTAADYVKVKGSNILWSAKDTGVAALSDLWKGYISPAHSCVMEREIHKPLTAEELNWTGWIYSLLTANNFGTNFMCSQSFDGVFKFSFGKAGTDDATANALWGERERLPLVTQFTDRSRGNLLVTDSLIDTGDLQCLSYKKAEDGSGYVLRLWNHAKEPMPLQVKICGKEISNMKVCDALERELGLPVPKEIAPNTVLTLKI